MVAASEFGTLPAGRPTLSIDGEVEVELSEKVLELSVSEDCGGMARCEVSLENWGPKAGSQGFLYLDGEKWEFGTQLTVHFGGLQSPSVFEGRVSGVEGQFSETEPPSVTLLAEDQLQKLRMKRRTRAHSGTDGAIAQTIAQEHGLSAAVSSSGPFHEVVAQVNSSDLAFLRERALATGNEVWLEGRTLHFEPRSGRDDGDALELAYRDQLLECRISADLATQRTALIVGGWDVANKSDIFEEVPPDIVSSELEGGQRSGPEHLASSFAEYKEIWAHQPAATAGEARAIGEAGFRAMCRRFVKGRCVADGRPEIRTGRGVELTGLGPFSGAYRVTEATHRFDRIRGYYTDFSVERAGFDFR